MTALQDRRARLLASLYAKFGEACDWTFEAGGAVKPVTVRRRSDDTDVAFGASDAVVDREIVRVRRAEIAMPAIGDLVSVDGGAFRVIADPRRSKHGLEWTCEVSLLRA